MSEIIESVKKSYTSTIGYEFMHIMDSKIRAWFLTKIEGKPTPYTFSDDEKEHVLKRLVDSSIKGGDGNSEYIAWFKK